VDRSSIDTHYSNYATGNCGHCHEQHASLGGSEPVPVGGGPDDYLLFDVMSSNTFCNTCHDGSPVTGDVARQTTDTSGHDPSISYVGTSGTISASCLDCHDPHVAQETTHSEAVDGNTASGVLLNVAGVRASWTGPPPAPTPGNETLISPNYTATDAITKEYELCLKCHSSYAFNTFPAGWTDQGKEFNPYNYSFHPVSDEPIDGQWNNTWLRANYANALWSPWNTLANRDARMHCSDCHGSNLAGPVGPHGSNVVYILKATGPVTNNYDDLCNMCHRPTNSSAFANHTRGQHIYPNNRLGCVGCHGGPVGNYGGRRGNVHGTNYRWASGQPAYKFLVGGYNYILTSNTCAASTVTTGINDGGCKGHPPKGY
jgi:hypothetical protein